MPYYIYLNGEPCGTSETWVDLPPPYELRDTPPEPKEKPKPFEPIPIVQETVETLSEAEFNKLKAKIDPTVGKLLELLYHQTMGNKGKVAKLSKDLKDDKKNDGTASPGKSN